MAGSVYFCCKSCNYARKVVTQIHELLKHYNWLLDSYVVDFFYEDLWSKLPSSWRNDLMKLSPQELGCWLLGEKKCIKTPLPLSLIALLRVTEFLQIKRDHNGDFVYKCQKVTNGNKIESSAATRLTYTVKSYANENNSLLKHVKEKKRYEIQKMGQILSDLSATVNSNCIVDIGAGLGHLSRFLTVKHNLQVICVEQDKTLLDSAKKWDDKLITTMQKQDETFQMKKPIHLAVTINSSNIQSELINKITNLVNLEHGLGIVGLHPCGDLAVNLLRLYTSCPEAKLLCIVGCCYMKLTTSDSSKDARGYPLSLYVSSIPNNKLSYNALEVACHAKEKHFDKIKFGDYDDLKIHTYRAVLEYLLAHMDVNNRHGQVRSVKLKPNTSFQQYCKLALENTKFQNELIFANLENHECSRMLDRWKEVLIFGCLRFMLAPLVETAVLLDRFLYLSERNLKPSLKAEFDCRVSPRNFVLTSYKT